MNPMARLSVTLEFDVGGYREIYPEIERRAAEFFDGDEFEVGWVDVTVRDLSAPIKVSALAYIPEKDAA